MNGGFSINIGKGNISMSSSGSINNREGSANVATTTSANSGSVNVNNPAETTYAQEETMDFSTTGTNDSTSVNTTDNSTNPTPTGSSTTTSGSTSSNGVNGGATETLDLDKDNKSKSGQNKTNNINTNTSGNSSSSSSNGFSTGSNNAQNGEGSPTTSYDAFNRKETSPGTSGSTTDKVASTSFDSKRDMDYSTTMATDEEMRKAMIEAGYTQKDIDRFLNGEISFDDLNIEIAKDPERMRKQLEVAIYKANDMGVSSTAELVDRIADLKKEDEKNAKVMEEVELEYEIMTRLISGENLDDILNSNYCLYASDCGRTGALADYVSSDFVDKLKGMLTQDKKGRYKYKGSEAFVDYYEPLEENFKNAWDKYKEDQRKINDEIAKLELFKTEVDELVQYELDYYYKYASKDDFDSKSIFDTRNIERLETLVENFENFDGQRMKKIMSSDKNALGTAIDCVLNGEMTLEYAIIDYDAMGEEVITYTKTRNGIANYKIVLTDKEGNKYIIPDPGKLNDDDFWRNYDDWSKQITENEMQVINYITATEGGEAVCEYLNNISTQLDKRWLKEQIEEDKQFASEHPVLASAISVVSTPVDGIKAAYYSISSRLTGDKIRRIDVYSAGDIWRAEVASDIFNYWDEKGHTGIGNTLSFTYSTGMSMLDSTSLIGVTMLTGGAGSAVISATLMGSRAYVSTLNDALDRGISDNRAVVLALAAATTETIMENYSLSHLMNLESGLSSATKGLIAKLPNNSFRQKIAYITLSSLSQAFVEGEEELATEVANFIVDELVSGDLSNFDLTVNKYMELGYSSEDAFKMAVKDTGHQFFEAYIGGFVSGFCFGGIKSSKTSHQISRNIAASMAFNFTHSESQFVDQLNFIEANQESFLKERELKRKQLIGEFLDGLKSAGKQLTKDMASLLNDNRGQVDLDGFSNVDSTSTSSYVKGQTVDEAMAKIASKHNYSEEMQAIIKPIYEGMLKEFGNEQLVFKAFENTHVISVDSINAYNKENGKPLLDDMANLFTTGATDPVANISYDEKSGKYSLDSYSATIAMVRLNLNNKGSISELTHELGHAIKTSYKINGDILTMNSGLLEETYKLTYEDGKVVQTKISEKGRGLEEALNTALQERVSRQILGDSTYNVQAYGQLKVTAENLMKTLDEKSNLILEAQTTQNSQILKSELGEDNYNSLLEAVEKIYNGFSTKGNDGGKLYSDALQEYVKINSEINIAYRTGKINNLLTEYNTNKSKQALDRAIITYGKLDGSNYDSSSIKQQLDSIIQNMNKEELIDLESSISKASESFKSTYGRDNQSLHNLLDDVKNAILNSQSNDVGQTINEEINRINQADQENYSAHNESTMNGITIYDRVEMAKNTLNNYLEKTLASKANVNAIKELGTRIVEHITGTYDIGFNEDYEDTSSNLEKITEIADSSDVNYLINDEESVKALVDGSIATGLMYQEHQIEAQTNFSKLSSKAKEFFKNAINNLLNINVNIANTIAKISGLTNSNNNILDKNIYRKFFGGLTYDIFSGSLVAKRHFAPVINSKSMLSKINNEGILHFTSLETANRILESGYVKPSSVLESDLTSKKSFFFAGTPTFEDLLINIPAYDVMTAIRIKPTLEQIQKLTYRALDDGALAYNGNLIFDKSQAEIVYYGLAFNEETQTIYLKELTLEEAKTYKVSDKVKELYNYNTKSNSLHESIKMQAYGLYAQYKHHQKLLQMQNQIRQIGLKNLSDEVLIEIRSIAEAKASVNSENEVTTPKKESIFSTFLHDNASKVDMGGSKINETVASVDENTGSLFSAFKDKTRSNSKENFVSSLSATTIDPTSVEHIDSAMQDRMVSSINASIARNGGAFISVANTSQLTTTVLGRVSDLSKVKVQILGGFADLNGNLKQKYNSEKYLSRVTYTGYEALQIVARIEQLESMVDKTASTIDKSRQIYDIIAKEIPVRHDYKTHPEHMDIFQSLRGITSYNALNSEGLVCAGYAQLFKELCNRCGVECDYIRGTAKFDPLAQSTGGGHAWNVILDSGRIIPVDVTWQASNNEDQFGYRDDFEARHIANDNETYRIYDKGTDIMKSVVDTLINKYGPDQTIRILEHLIETKDYNCITRENGARSSIKMLSTDKIKSFLMYKSNLDYVNSMMMHKYGADGHQGFVSFLANGNFAQITRDGDARHIAMSVPTDMLDLYRKLY